MTLILNKDFRCNQTICFGIKGVHDQFKILQSTINRFASVGQSFTPLLVDGFIGDKTVNAANQAAQAAGVQSPGSTREQVASNALLFTAQLQSVIRDLEIVGAIPTTTTVTPNEPPPPEVQATIQQTVIGCRAGRNDPNCVKAKLFCQRVKGTAEASQPGVEEICAATHDYRWIWWTALLGGLAVATATGGYMLYRRRRLRSASGYSQQRGLYAGDN